MTLIPRPQTGRYVSFEGVEGSGKTYYLRKLHERHPDKFTPVLELSKEGLGEKILYVLSHESDEFFRHGHPVSEALLFFAMKLFEFDNSIVPLLMQGKTVVEDRSADTNCLYSAILLNEKYGASTYKYYQELMIMRKALAPIPDITICFVPDLDKALARAQERDGRKYTPSEQAFVQNAFKGYEELCSRESERIVKIEPDSLTSEVVLERLAATLGF